MISIDRGSMGCFHYIWPRSMDFQTVAESYCQMVRICLSHQALFTNVFSPLLHFNQ